MAQETVTATVQGAHVGETESKAAEADKLFADMQPEAEKRIKSRLVLEAIVKAENIEVSDEEYESELNKMAESYGMEVDKIKEFMGDYEKKQMKEDLAVQDAVTLLADNAKEVEVKADDAVKKTVDAKAEELKAE